MPTRKELNETFDVLAKAAAAGVRCPQNGTEGVKSEAVVALCHAGRIRVKVSGHNWRQVDILTGEHKDKSTAADPHGHKIFLIIDQDGTHNLAVPPPPKRQQPSAPRLLPYAGKSA